MTTARKQLRRGARIRM